MTREVNRRDFMAATATAGGIGSDGCSSGSSVAGSSGSGAVAKPAVLGGTPVRTEGFYPWPVPTAEDEQAVLEVVRSASWYRAESVMRFEEEYAGTEQRQVLRGHLQRHHRPVLVAGRPGRRARATK